MSSDVFDGSCFNTVLEVEFSKLQQVLVSEHKRQVAKIAASYSSSGDSRRGDWCNFSVEEVTDEATALLEESSCEIYQTATANLRDAVVCSEEDDFATQLSVVSEEPAHAQLSITSEEPAPSAQSGNAVAPAEKPNGFHLTVSPPQSPPPLVPVLQDMAGMRKASCGLDFPPPLPELPGTLGESLAETKAGSRPTSASKEAQARMAAIKRASFNSRDDQSDDEVIIAEVAESTEGNEGKKEKTSSPTGDGTLSDADSEELQAVVPVQSLHIPAANGMRATPSEVAGANKKLSLMIPAKAQLDKPRSSASAAPRNGNGSFRLRGSTLDLPTPRGSTLELPTDIPDGRSCPQAQAERKVSAVTIRTSKRSMTLPNVDNIACTQVRNSRLSNLGNSSSNIGTASPRNSSFRKVSSAVDAEVASVTNRASTNITNRVSMNNRVSFSQSARFSTADTRASTRAIGSVTSLKSQSLTVLDEAGDDQTTADDLERPGSSGSNHSMHSSGSNHSECLDHYEVLQLWLAAPQRGRKSTVVNRTRKDIVAAPTNVFEHNEEENDEVELKGMRKFMLSPGSAPHIAWDMCGLMLIGWDCIYIPLQWFSPPDHVFTDLMQWIARLYWTFALGLFFFIGYINDKGNVEMRPIKVARRYFATWFSLDFFLVMFDWLEALDVAGSFLSVGATFRSLRMMRIVRLLRMIKAPLIWRYLTEQIRSEELVLVAHICKIMVFMLMVVHFLACAWYGLGVVDLGSTRNWIEAEAEEGHGSHVLFQDLATKYTTSFHWSLSVFSGETLIMPLNIAERSYTIVVLFFAFMVSASLVSSITTAMTRLEIMSRQNTQNLMQLRRYLMDQAISRKLAVRIQRNAKHVMLEQKRNMPESSVELLKLISDPLLVELHFEVRSLHLMEHPFFCCFNDVNPAGIRKVCHLAVRILSLSSGDVLFSDGEAPTHPSMYFLMGGRVRYKQESLSANDLLSVGQWLSEASLWTHWTHHGTLRAESEHARLIVIDATKFQDICTAFPMVQLQHYAEAFVEVMNMLDKSMHSDLGDFDENMQDMIAYAFPELVYAQELDKEQESDDEGRRSSFRESVRRNSTCSSHSEKRFSGVKFGHRSSIGMERPSTFMGKLGSMLPGKKSNGKQFHKGVGAGMKKGVTSNNLANLVHRSTLTRNHRVRQALQVVCCPCFAISELIFWILTCCRCGGQERSWSLVTPSVDREASNGTSSSTAACTEDRIGQDS